MIRFSHTHPFSEHTLIFLCLLLLSADFLTEGSENQNAQGVVQLNIQGFSRRKSTIGVLLFNNPKGFPDDQKQAMRRQWIPISDAKTTQTSITLYDLSPNIYAISAFQDENNNSRLDRNFLGIPTEPQGCSNNPRPRFRAPRFSESRFEVSGKPVNITIILSSGMTRKKD